MNQTPVGRLHHGDVILPPPRPPLQEKYDQLRREYERGLSEAKLDAKQAIRDARQKYQREWEEKMKRARGEDMKKREELATEVDDMHEAMKAMESKVYILSLPPLASLHEKPSQDTERGPHPKTPPSVLLLSSPHSVVLPNASSSALKRTKRRWQRQGGSCSRSEERWARPGLTTMSGLGRLSWRRRRGRGRPRRRSRES